jgi:hypothetical protein
MADTPIPPPYPAGSTPSTVKGHASNMARNVTVSVLSTVLGATMIWLLGFNHSSGSGSNFLEIKDATISAWKSYETYENTYTKNSQSLLQDIRNIGLDEYIKQIHMESDKFLKSVGELATNKNIDKDLITALNRRIDNEKLTMPKVDNYVNGIKDIVNGNLSDDEKKTALHNADLKWASISEGMFQRAVNDIGEIAKTLSERYAQRFSMDDFLVIQLYNQNKKTADSLTNLNQNNPVTNPGNNNNNNNNPGNITPTDPNNNNANNNNNVSNAGYNNATTNTTNNNSAVATDGKILAGKWSTTGANIELSQNGKFYWEVLSTGDKSTGTWQFYNNQLYMYPVSQGNNGNTTWAFNLSNVTTNSFTMQLAVSPYNMYSLVRNINGN